MRNRVNFPCQLTTGKWVDQIPNPLRLGFLWQMLKQYEEGFSTDFRGGNSCCIQILYRWIYHKNLNWVLTTVLVVTWLITFLKRWFALEEVFCFANVLPAWIHRQICFTSYFLWANDPKAFILCCYVYTQACCSEVALLRMEGWQELEYKTL